MKHQFRTSLAIISIFTLISIYGCGAEPPKPTAENLKAKRALGMLEEMRAAYVARDMQGVMGHVSSGFEGGYSDLSGRVRKDMDIYKKVELKLFIERVELEPGVVKAVFHWQGKWWDSDGKPVEGRGNTVFSFTDDEKMPLVKVTGDYPFGIVR